MSFCASGSSLNFALEKARALLADLVEIGVTNAAIQNFDLYVVFGWVAPPDL